MDYFLGQHCCRDQRHHQPSRLVSCVSPLPQPALATSIPGSSGSPRPPRPASVPRDHPKDCKPLQVRQRCFRSSCVTNAEGESGRTRRMRCCARDGGRSSGAALQGEAPNRRRLRRLSAGRGERCGKGAPRVRQVWVRKASESEPLLTCSKKFQWRRNRGETWSRDKSGGSLLTAQMASGI